MDLDNERAELDAFLKEHQLAWPQIFEAGGMESRLAVDYGIISLPTMFLVDADGKVLNRNLRTSAEVDRQLEKLLAQKPPGVALERRRSSRRETLACVTSVSVPSTIAWATRSRSNRSLWTDQRRLR